MFFICINLVLCGCSSTTNISRDEFTDEVKNLRDQMNAMNEKVSMLNQKVDRFRKDFALNILKIERLALGDLLAYFSNIKTASNPPTIELLFSMYKLEAKVWSAKKKELDRLFDEIMEAPGIIASGKNI